MFGLVLALVCTQAPAEKMIYFPGLEWHNDVELKAGEKVTLVGYSAGARIASLMAFDPANKGKIDTVVLLNSLSWRARPSGTAGSGGSRSGA